MSDTDSTKCCSKCKREWPATPEYFRPSTRYRSGFRSDCRACERDRVKALRERSDYSERYRAENQARNEGRAFSGEPRQCSICDNAYPGTPEYFRRDNSKPDGLRGSCKACNSKRNMEWYYANWERELKKRREFSARWRKTPRAKMLSRAKDVRRRDAIRSGGPCITADEIVQMYDDQGGLCAYCDTPLFGEYHVDHMLPATKGGRNDWTNIAISCPLCNWRKNDRTAEEYMMVLLE